MVIDYIAGGTLLASLATLIGLGVRKFPLVRTVDIDGIVKERNARTKHDLIAQRLRRKLWVGLNWAKTQAKPVGQKAQSGLKSFVERIEEMEKEYRNRAHTVRMLPGQEAGMKLQILLDEAEAFHKAGELEKAEQKYIEAISHAPSSVPAFQQLGELYLEEKEYEHAKESLAYALKLEPKNAELLLDLASIHSAMGEHAAALSCCQQAVTAEPNDPKNLHALLDASIVMQERELAERTLRQLEAVNPENQKLPELKAAVDALPPLQDTITRK